MHVNIKKIKPQRYYIIIKYLPCKSSTSMSSSKPPLSLMSTILNISTLPAASDECLDTSDIKFNPIAEISHNPRTLVDIPLKLFGIPPPPLDRILGIPDGILILAGWVWPRRCGLHRIDCPGCRMGWFIEWLREINWCSPDEVESSF